MFHLLDKRVYINLSGQNDRVKYVSGQMSGQILGQKWGQIFDPILIYRKISN